jgi:hypothetical protein
VGFEGIIDPCPLRAFSEDFPSFSEFLTEGIQRTKRLLK